MRRVARARPGPDVRGQRLGGARRLTGLAGRTRRSTSAPRPVPARSTTISAARRLQTVRSPRGDVEMPCRTDRDAVRICRASFDALSTTDERAFASTRAPPTGRVAARRRSAGGGRAATSTLPKSTPCRSDSSSSSCGARRERGSLARNGEHADAATTRARGRRDLVIPTRCVDRARTHSALAEVLAATGVRRGEAKREAAEAERLLPRRASEREREPLGLPFADLTYPPPPSPPSWACAASAWRTSFRAPTLGGVANQRPTDGQRIANEGARLVPPSGTLRVLLRG